LVAIIPSFCASIRISTQGVCLAYITNLGFIITIKQFWILGIYGFGRVYRAFETIAVIISPPSTLAFRATAVFRTICCGCAGFNNTGLELFDIAVFTVFPERSLIAVWVTLARTRCLIC
jgi:hypothetical protein